MSTTRHRPFLSAVLASVFLAAGPSRAADVKPGVVFVVGGAGGWDVLGKSARLAFGAGDVPHEIREFPWSHGFGRLLQDLQDWKHLQEKASALAMEVRQVKGADPDRPVYLVGKSAGTAIVLGAAAELPAETLERIVLLSSAVSPDYDLGPALRATRREIVSFWSPHDRLVLGWGTGEFGTADRVYGQAAGLVGFRRPVVASSEEENAYQRLVEVRWSPRMIWHGYFGDHVGTSLPLFLYAEVAPWLDPASTGGSFVRPGD
jgi:pimeloyl-ACP methyl ester carboxylesterase